MNTYVRLPPLGPAVLGDAAIPGGGASRSAGATTGASSTASRPPTNLLVVRQGLSRGSGKGPVDFGPTGVPEPEDREIETESVDMKESRTERANLPDNGSQVDLRLVAGKAVPPLERLRSFGDGGREWLHRCSSAMIVGGQRGGEGPREGV